MAGVTLLGFHYILVCWVWGESKNGGVVLSQFYAHHVHRLFHIHIRHVDEIRSFVYLVLDSDSEYPYQHIKRSLNENKNKPVLQLLADDKNTYTYICPPCIEMWGSGEPVGRERLEFRRAFPSH